MDALDRLRLRLPDAAEDALLMELLAGAEEAICACTGRDSLPEALVGAQVALAAAAFNRMGMEGETAHAEGGVSRTAPAMPEDIRRQIAPYRLAKTV